MIPRISRKVMSEATMIEDSVNRFLRENELRDNADKYYISVQGSVVESKNLKKLQSLSERFVEKNITACVVTNYLLDDTKMITEQTGGLYYDKNICLYGEPIADYIIKFHKMKSNGKIYRTVLPTGWKVVALEADITSDYKTVSDRGVTDEDRIKYADQDNDGLLDLEELRYTYGKKQIINWDTNGKVLLPTVQDCIDFFKERPYMTNPLAQYGSMDLSAFEEWRILPIKSDPSSDDSDGDGLYDGGEKEVGTNLLSYDSDGDGLDDYTELENWFDPLDPNPYGDSYNDLQEYRNETDPYVYDLDELEWAAAFFKGATLGDFVESDNIPILLGQITSGFVSPVADIRDTVANIVHFRWGSAALSAVGMIPAAGDAVKMGERLTQFISKHIDDAPMIINATSKISEESSELIKHLPSSSVNDVEKSLGKVEKMTKSEYDNIGKAYKSAEKNIDDVLNPEIKKSEEKFITASKKECKNKNCFVAGTLVTTSEGQKPIEDIKIGDRVLSEKENTNQVSFKNVTNTFVNETSELEHIHVNGETITATPNHPFYVDKLGWRLADALRAGDVLVLSNGEFVTVEWVQHEILESPIEVYNFEVEDFHTYFVGENSILVHNDCHTPVRPNKITDIADKCGDELASIVEGLSKERKDKFLDIFNSKSANTRFIDALNNAKDKNKVVDFLVDSGDDAADAIARFKDKADDVIDAVKKCSTSELEEDAIKILGSRYNNGKTLEAINEYGDNAVKALNNMSKSNYGKVSNYIAEYGNDVVDIFADHGKDAYNAMENCSDMYKTDAIRMIKEEGGPAARYIKRNAKDDAGVKRFLEGNYGKYETKPLPNDFTCINKDLAGKTHPQTGVPFEERTVTLGGKESKVVVPKFESEFEATLTDDMLKSSDATQFGECNAQLKETLDKNPELKNQFDAEQLAQIEKGKTPDGYTWHHDAETGKLQLVDEQIHSDTRHTGGRAIWGGGQEARK